MSGKKLLPKILIVEDRRLIRHSFQTILGGLANIIFATSPNEAKLAIEQNPNLAFIAVDGSLVKHGDGVEVITYARKLCFTNPIFAISGEDNSQLMKAGADKAVNKPDSFLFLEKKLKLMAKS